jgi:hypothetical protein
VYSLNDASLRLQAAERMATPDSADLSGQAMLLVRAALVALTDAEQAGATTAFVRAYTTRAVVAHARRVIFTVEGRRLDDYTPLIGQHDSVTGHGAYLRPALRVAAATLLHELARADVELGRSTAAVDRSLDAITALAPAYEGFLPLRDAYYDVALIGSRVAGEMDAVLEDPGLPLVARRSLAVAVAQVGVFREGLLLVRDGAGTSRRGTDQEYMQRVYLPAAWAAAELAAVQDRSVYTAYWRQGLGMVLVDLVNRSLQNTVGRFPAAASDAGVLHAMTRFDIASAALANGEPLVALDSYVGCRCLMLALYNRYFAGDRGYNGRINAAVETLADGTSCPADDGSVLALCQ